MKKKCKNHIMVELIWFHVCNFVVFYKKCDLNSQTINSKLCEHNINVTIFMYYYLIYLQNCMTQVCTLYLHTSSSSSSSNNIIMWHTLFPIRFSISSDEQKMIMTNNHHNNNNIRCFVCLTISFVGLCACGLYYKLKKKKKNYYL